MNPFHSFSNNISSQSLSNITSSIIQGADWNVIKPRDIMRSVDQDHSQNIRYITAFKSLIRYNLALNNISKDSYSYINSSIFNINLGRAYTCLKTKKTIPKGFLWLGKPSINFIL